MLSERDERELMGGGDTRLHHHLEDRVTNPQLQEQLKQSSISSSTYTILPEDDILLIDTSAGSVTVTLPVARNGKEYEVVKMTSGNAVFIEPVGNGDTVLGSLTGVVINNQYDAIRLKATTGGWIAI